jgi:predicted nucleotidyltransferase
MKTKRPAVGSAPPGDVLNEIIRRIVEVARPDRIILFGSAARREMGRDSDIDLLVFWLSSLEFSTAAILPSRSI